MKRVLACLVFSAVIAGCAPPQPPPNANQLTPQEVAEGWVLLFDGKTTKGWTTTGDMSVHNGLLTIDGKQPSSVATVAAYGDFEARLLYRETPGSRCRYRLTENVGAGHPSWEDCCLDGDNSPSWHELTLHAVGNRSTVEDSPLGPFWAGSGGGESWGDCKRPPVHLELTASNGTLVVRDIKLRRTPNGEIQQPFRGPGAFGVSVP